MDDNITVLGGGAWGTAIASLLATNGHDVTLWCFEQEVVNEIVQNRINKQYLPGFELSDRITPTTSLADALGDAKTVFVAIPVLFLRAMLAQTVEYAKKNQTWVLLGKGIEKGTGKFPSDIVGDVFGFEPQMAILSGPNFASQLARQSLTQTVVAAKSLRTREALKQLCENEYFKICLSDDIYGVQVGGALKNVMSLFMGILDGDRYSENTRAAFLVRTLEEMVVFAQYYGGRAETIYGLSGLGDLVLGLLGEKNRNYRVGEWIGKGNTLFEISGMTEVLPEGINTIESVYDIIKSSNGALRLPVCEGVYSICFEGKLARDVVKDLF